MSKQPPPIVMLDTSFLDCLLNDARSEHDIARKHFDFWVKNRVVIYTSTICLAEFAANAEHLHPIFSQIIQLPFNAESALLAGELFRKYKKTVIATMKGDAKPGIRDALKDDFKIVAAALNANVNAIAHNDPATMSKFLSCAQKEFEQCHDLNAILLKDGFDETKARQVLGLAVSTEQSTFLDSLMCDESQNPETKEMYEAQINIP